MRERSLVGDGRSTVDTIGYLLVFLLVVASIAAISVIGFGQLGAVQGANEANNVQRGFDVLAENVDDLVFDGVESRTTEVRVANSEVALDRPITVVVEGHRVGDPGQNFSEQFDVRPLVYRTDRGESVVYVTGAVIRDPGHGSSPSMARDPGIVVGANRSIITVVRPTVDGPRAVGGSGTVHVLTTRKRSHIRRLNHSEYELTINVTSPRVEAWARYLEGFAATTCSRPAPDTVSCTFVTDRFVVTVVDVGVTLSK